MTQQERILSLAQEPFKPIHTMDDVLKREAEIREASLEAYKEEGKRMGPDRRKTETERCGFIPPLNHNVKFDF